MRKHTSLMSCLLVLLLGPWRPLGSEAQPALKVRDAVVVLKSKNDVGSGFLLANDKKVWLVTNAHVTRGGRLKYVRTIGGKSLRLGSFQVAQDRDLARFEVLNATTNEAFVHTDNISVGMPIVAYGNSQGRGTVPELLGKVIAEGPATLEIDAEIVPGNSGGPVLNAKGQVVGVSTYGQVHEVPEGEVDWAAGTRFVKIRRFATRLDQDVEWIAVDIDKYYAQVAFLRDVGTLIAELGPAFQHYYSKSTQALSYNTAKAAGGYKYSRLHNSIRAFYEDYGQYEASLKNVQESYDTLKGKRGASALFLREEERKLRLARRIRDQKVAKFSSTATKLCRRPINTLSATEWMTSHLDDEASQLLDLLVFIDKYLSRLAADAVQRKTWE
jgi:hypothetical protein